MKTHYYLANDELVIEDIEDNSVKWKGKIGGLPIHTLLSIPDIEDCIVLLNYWENGNRFQNLLRINSTGSVVWRAMLPSDVGVDSYVRTKWQSGDLLAWSWSGFMVTIDISTGNIITQKFTK
jgi:hypothetical protein